jgi:putative ABC transport system ATP-binding protein
MTLGTRNGFILLDNLWKQFQEGSKKREVLRGTGAAFQRGEFIAILGKSGSGKSTLLNVISGIDEPDQGDIKINGQLLTQLDEYQRTIVGAEVEDAVEKSSMMLAEVGLSDRLNTFPERLSGGEQQRVAIARAIVHDPLVVLADEPTGNLDEETGEQVLNLLDKLTRQAGKNLIMVTHSKENAIYADRLFELHAGCLVELEKN